MHEQSETVQDASGKWINVYGRGTRQAGQPLPGSRAYDTVDEAVAAAKQRSKEAAPAESRGLQGLGRPSGTPPKDERLMDLIRQLSEP